jgi:hypothetical protein
VSWWDRANHKGSFVYTAQKRFQSIFGFTLPLFFGRGIFNCELTVLCRDSSSWGIQTTMAWWLVTLLSYCGHYSFHCYCRPEQSSWQSSHSDTPSSLSLESQYQWRNPIILRVRCYMKSRTCIFKNWWGKIYQVVTQEEIADGTVYGTSTKTYTQDTGRRNWR